MTDIVFEQTLGGNFFSFKDEKGNDNWFDYRPKVDGLWKDIKLSDFDVQLLIHPVLNKESNTFALEAKVNDVDETIGYLFPVAALDSDDSEGSRTALNNYLYVAYKVLLQRLRGSDIKPGVDSLGRCFESNICVCVLNLKTIGKNLGVSNCIHSLREKGYSYFIENNNYNQVKGYTYELYKELVRGSRIKVQFSVPPIYTNPIIDGIIRMLPSADNLVYRFVLLYQVIEFLLSRKIKVEIESLIEDFQNSEFYPENDFLDSMSNLRKEKSAIVEILKESKVEDLDCFKSFNSNCQHLFNLAGIIPQKKTPLFYSFRNQMVHSYRQLSQFEAELANTVFYFEQVILSIMEKHPYV